MLLKFFEALQSFRPETSEQFFEHRKKAPAAMQAAAEKILQLEKDPTSPAAQKAKLLLLGAKVASLAEAEEDEQRAIVSEIGAVLNATPLVSRNELGISLDTERGRLEEFLEKNELPWKTLFEDGGGWDHPIAAHYGVMGIPTVVLVDKEGKVISLNARGPELGRLLKKLLGPTDAE